MERVRCDGGKKGGMESLSHQQGVSEVRSPEMGLEGTGRWRASSQAVDCRGKNLVVGSTQDAQLPGFELQRPPLGCFPE